MALTRVGYAGVTLYNQLVKELKSKKLLKLVFIDRKSLVMDVSYDMSVKESDIQKIIDKLTLKFGQIIPESGKGRLKTKEDSVTFGDSEKPQLGTFRVNFILKQNIKKRS